jgi:hypothetical protein
LCYAWRQFRQIKNRAAGERQIVNEFPIDELPGGSVLRLQWWCGLGNTDRLHTAFYFKLDVSRGVLPHGERDPGLCEVCIPGAETDRLYSEHRTLDQQLANEHTETFTLHRLPEKTIALEASQAA